MQERSDVEKVLKAGPDRRQREPPHAELAKTFTRCAPLPRRCRWIGRNHDVEVSQHDDGRRLRIKAAGGLARLLQGWKQMGFQNTSPDEGGKSLSEGDRPRLHTTLCNPLDEGASERPVPGGKGSPLGKDPPDKGTATDYGCCESKRSGDRHPGGVPAGQGETAVKRPWKQEA